MFDNRIVHVFDWLLNGNLMRGGTLMQRKIVIPTVFLIVVLAGGGAFAFLHGSASKNSAAPPPSPPMPVVAGTVAQHDVPIYLTGVGTVIAYNTVIIRSQIQGQIVSINFTEGQAARIVQGRCSNHHVD
jgi:membrane fusion protein, multidrug efflux system